MARASSPWRSTAKMAVTLRVDTEFHTVSFSPGAIVVAGAGRLARGTTYHSLVGLRNPPPAYYPSAEIAAQRSVPNERITWRLQPSDTTAAASADVDRDAAGLGVRDCAVVVSWAGRHATGVGGVLVSVGVCRYTDEF
ncbi:MAG: hypothetical protein A2V70_07820 [Planctomycetes bacterium RBG_13_63_9]|nr:MAG: hypothetical protein A2V70_07820 [Planctomycetes bacterium RBG_13_63_9]